MFQYIKFDFTFFNIPKLVLNTSFTELSRFTIRFIKLQIWSILNYSRNAGSNQVESKNGIFNLTIKTYA